MYGSERVNVNFKIPEKSILSLRKVLDIFSERGHDARLTAESFLKVTKITDVTELF